MNTGGIYYGDPVDRAHPLNKGLAAWWMALPWYSSGPRMIDIAGKAHGTFGPTTQAPARVPGFDGCGGLSFTAASSQYVSATPATGVLPDLGAALTMEWVVTHSGVNNEHIFTLAKDDTGSANNAMGLVCSTEFSLNNWYVRTWSNAPLARIYPAPYNPALPSPIGVPVHLIFAVSAGQSNGFFWINGTPAQTIHDPRTGTESGNVGAVSFGRFTAAFPTPYFGARLYHAAVFHGRATDSFAAGRYDQWRRGFPDLIQRLKPWSFGFSVGGGGGTTVTPTTAALTLTTFAPTITTPQLVTPGVASLTLTTFAPTVATPRLATPTTAALTLTTFAPAVTATANVAVTPTTAALTLTAFAPTVTGGAGQTATPTTYLMVLTTFAPAVTATAHVTATPTTAALTLTTFAPGVTGGAGLTVVPGTRALTLTTFAPTVTAIANVTVTPTTAALTLTTFAPAVATPRLATPTTLVLTLTSFEPTVTGGGSVLLTPGTLALTLATFAPAVAGNATPRRQEDAVCGAVERVGVWGY